jgi:hypothetical protein
MKLRSPGEKPVIRGAEVSLLRRLVEHFTPTGSGAGASALTETLALPLLALALAFWLNPLDPFFLSSQFAWVWLGPVLVALRYGPFPGLAGSAIVFAAWFVFGKLGVALGVLPKLYFLGWLITVMICGEFSSLWRSRVRRAESVQGYLEQRLEYLTHQHYLLRLSHDRLEQDLISRPVSMRDALVSLRALSIRPVVGGVTASRRGRTAASGGAVLPDRARRADRGGRRRRIRRFAGRASGRGVRHRCERFADPFRPRAPSSGPHRARRRARTERVALSGRRTADRHARFDARPAGGAGHAVLRAARRNAADAQSAARILCRRSVGSELAAPLRSDHPDCPLDFAFELSRMWRVRVDSGVASALVVLEFADDAEDDLALQISRIQRSLDIVWLVRRPSGARLITLMPLAGSAAIEGYLARIDTWLAQHRSGGLDVSRVGHRSFMLDDMAPSALLARILKDRHGS